MQPHLHSLFSFIGMIPRAGSLPSTCSCHSLSVTSSLLINAFATAFPFSVTSPVSFIMPYALLLPSNISLNFTLWPSRSWFTSVGSKGWLTNVVTINFALLILSYLKRLIARWTNLFHIFYFPFLYNNGTPRGGSPGVPP